jgi:hypothetical protein
MYAYKLFRLHKDGSLSSLFINRARRLPLGEWMEAETIPTKGFEVRTGWHCLPQPHAPHLTLKGRVWRKVEIRDYDIVRRPASQGGMWYLAQHLRILKKPVSISIDL